MKTREQTLLSPSERFIDTGKVLMAFAEEVLVNCVSCGTAGIVTAKWEPYQWDAHFQCSRCCFELHSSKCHWVGPVRVHGRQPCDYCGYKWLTPALEFKSPPDEPPDQLEVYCHECEHITLIKASLSRIFPGDRCCDPHFGLPLRLSMDTRLGTVWAYNQKHVTELTGYVLAKLRVRQNASNKAMFSRLPKWMKLAKHRVEVAKALSKLSAMD